MIIFLKIMFLLQEGSNKATQSPYASNIWESNGCLMLIRVNRTGNPFTVVSGIPQAEPQSISQIKIPEVKLLKSML